MTTPVRAAVSVVTAAVLVLAAAAPAAARPRPDRTPPTNPTNLRVTAVTHTSATLAWNPSTDNSGQVHYVVWSPGRSGVVPATAPQATVTGLTPGTAYEFRVQAWDPSYNGSGVSNAAFVTTTADTAPPTTPAALTVLQVDRSKALIRFTRGVDTLGTTTHRVLVDGVPSPDVASLLTPGIFPRPAVEQAWVRRLEPGRTVSIAVQAVDPAGNRSAVSAAVTVTTAPSADVTAPTTPTLLRAASGGNGACPEEIWAAWTAVTDDGPAAEIEYEFRINAVINEVAPMFTQTVAYTEVPNRNTVTVVAVDRAGNASAPSNAIDVDVNFVSC